MGPDVIGRSQSKHTQQAAYPFPMGEQSQSEPCVRLFEGLNKSDITRILASGVVRRFEAGRIIVHANEPGTHLYLLKTGSVNYFRESSEGKQILIIPLSPGDTFGLGTLLPKPVEYIGTAEAVRETELLVWDHSSIREFSAKHPLLVQNALEIGLEYIRLYSDRHAALITKSAEGRMAGMLALAGIRVGRRTARGVEVQMTNEHLASLADVSRFTASRLLKKWAGKGAVEKTRGKIVIRSPEKMLGVAVGVESETD